MQQGDTPKASTPSTCAHSVISLGDSAPQRWTPRTTHVPAPAEASLATEAFLSLRPSDKASFECSLPELKTVCVGDEECAVGDTVRDRMLEWLEGQDAEKLGITERGSRTAPRPPACSGASIRLGVTPRYLPLRRGVRLGVDELLRARLDAAHGDVALERRVLRALRVGHDVLDAPSTLSLRIKYILELVSPTHRRESAPPFCPCVFLIGPGLGGEAGSRRWRWSEACVN